MGGETRLNAAYMSQFFCLCMLVTVVGAGTQPSRSPVRQYRRYLYVLPGTDLELAPHWVEGWLCSHRRSL